MRAASNATRALFTDELVPSLAAQHAATRAGEAAADLARGRRRRLHAGLRQPDLRQAERRRRGPSSPRGDGGGLGPGRPAGLDPGGRRRPLLLGALDLQGLLGGRQPDGEPDGRGALALERGGRAAHRHRRELLRPRSRQRGRGQPHRREPRAPRQARDPRLGRLGEAPAPQASDPREARVGRRPPDLLDPAPGARAGAAGDRRRDGGRGCPADPRHLLRDGGRPRPAPSGAHRFRHRGGGRRARAAPGTTPTCAATAPARSACSRRPAPPTSPSSSRSSGSAVHRLGEWARRWRASPPLWRSPCSARGSGSRRAVTAAALAAGPPSLRGRRQAHPPPRRRDVRPPDVDVHDGPRAALRRSRARPGAGCGSTTRSAPTPCSAAASCRTSASSGPSQASAGETTVDRFLSWAHWAWFLEPHGSLDLDPGPAPRALRALGAADVRGLRHRLRDLHGGPHGAAMVGIRGGLHRREGTADHAGGRRGGVGAGLAGPLRHSGRKPVGRDALPPLRHLADGRAAALGDRSGGRGVRAGPTPGCWASRSSTWASTTWSTCSPGRRSWSRSAAASATSSRSHRRSAAGCSGSSASQIPRSDPRRCSGSVVCEHPRR